MVEKIENSNENKSIKIDLDKLFSDRNILANDLIHQKTRKDLDSLLIKMIDKSTASKVRYSNSAIDKQLNTIRSNNTIFIHGKRGAGKTTFLKSILLHHLENKDKDPKVFPVAFIDPTLIDTQQHLLVDIIVRMDMEVKSKLKNCYDENTQRQYRKKLEDMSEGLKLLKNYDLHQTDDAQWFLSRALRDSRHGQSLENHFNEFIEEVLNILGTDLLLIAIDDVDTETAAAYQVLEILRCYITHPKVCVVITGDEELYNFIVYEKKLESLGGSKASTSNNDSQIKDKKSMAMHLTQQYLLKILPVHQRLQLQDVYTLVNGHSNIEIEIIDKKNKKSIKDYWREVFCNGLYLTEDEADKFINVILKQPIRSILQLAYKLEQDSLSTSLKLNPYHLIDGISQVFFTELFGERVEVEELNRQKVSPNDIGKTMVKLYAQYGELETGFYARPDTNFTTFNIAQLLLSAAIANYTQPNISKDDNNNSIVLANTLNAMITTGAACNIFMTYVENSEKLKIKVSKSEKYSEIEKNNDLINQYSNYIGLNGKDNLYNIAAHYSPIVLEHISRGQLMLASGVVRTKRKSDTKLRKYLETATKVAKDKDENENNNSIIAQSGTLDRLKDTILNSSVLKKDEFKSSLYAGITIVVASHAINSSSGTNDYISCYTLLSFISELLDRDITDDNKGTLYQLLLKRLEIPTYGAPPFFNSSSDVDSDSTNETDDFLNRENNGVDDEHIEDVAQKLWEWKKIQPNSFGVSSVLQGKIWARVFYSLNRVSEEFRKGSFFAKKRVIPDVKAGSNVLLHEFMCISIAAIVNAFLIEESRFSYQGSKADKDKLHDISKMLQTAENVATTVDKLGNSLAKVTKVLDSSSDFSKFFPLTFGLITCPLLMPYLTYDLSEFDAAAEVRWKDKRGNDKIVDFIKSILTSKEGENIKGIFGYGTWEAATKYNNSIASTKVDMYYISAIPIALSN
ncbi:hypothetical protein [Psychrobacter nivimaris]|uniref:hypothetical protein n=1 Tax=Psychrobacter nivimaris TaxID=281738 RepID=UPI003734E375